MHTDPWHVHPGVEPSQVLLHVPHSSRVIPTDLRQRLLLSDDELAEELDRMTDSGTAELAANAAAQASVRPWSFVNGRSRLVVDPERFPDDREEMRSVGMGVVYTQTSDGRPLRHEDPVLERRLIEMVFTPYAEALADAVDDRLAAAGGCVLLDVHSFPAQALPYELHPDDRRPQVCLGTDESHTPDWLVTLARVAFQGFDVELDQPFRGTYVPLRHYGLDPRVRSLMVEVRRDVPPDSPALSAALAALVDACT